MSTKDSLIKGTLVLAIAAFIARFLGIFQRVPLQNMLGDNAMATYGIANSIYFLLLMIATAGIPVAISKLVSERIAVGKFAEAQRIYAAAIKFAIFAGLFMTTLLWFASDYYATNIAKDKDAVLAIRALAPALLFFPVIAIMRGYFQGRQQMMGNGISQIVEQIVRVIVSVGLASLLLFMGTTEQMAIAGATFGGVVGGVAALLVMLFYWRRLKKQDIKDQQPDISNEKNQEEIKAAKSLTYRKIYKMIFKISGPVILIAIAVPAINFIDSSTVISLLEGKLGYSSAEEMLGILQNRAQALAGLPIIFSIAISQSILPIISSAYAKKDQLVLNRQTSLALRMSILFSLPVILVLCIAAEPINVLLFKNTLGTSVIVYLTASTIFQVLMMTSGTILMGLGQFKRPMIHVSLGVILKVAGNFLLAPWLGIGGIILSTAISFSIVMILNLLYLKKTVSYTILGKKWIGTIVTSLLLIGVGYLITMFNQSMIQLSIERITYAVHSIILGPIIGILYLLFMIKFRVITENDIRHLPIRIQKVMQKVLRLINR
ncbi:putative polysaccharide biosynthesis protein [Chengkuizengella sediminis]|uniref:putative polysaccharide biosynthesis protein n=1 Tax=Chengkuizengella sediminis TaxID=1885917 RepID=UPI00138A4B65|nr:polysaccharide biosynthesis protein [Chengkuizengella sediminis]NDI36777.1 polysaccharide biosynthesis protein [Chengkuizengella sediminis]